MRIIVLLCIFYTFCFLKLSAFPKQERGIKHSVIILNKSSFKQAFYYGKNAKNLSFYQIEASSAAVFPLINKSDRFFFRFKDTNTQYFLNSGKYYIVSYPKNILKIYKNRFYNVSLKNYQFLIGIWYWGENSDIFKDSSRTNTFVYEFYPNNVFLTVNKKFLQTKKGRWRIFKLGKDLYLELTLTNGYKKRLKIKKKNENLLFIYPKGKNPRILKRLMGYY